MKLQRIENQKYRKNKRRYGRYYSKRFSINSHKLTIEKMPQKICELKKQIADNR